MFEFWFESGEICRIETLFIKDRDPGTCTELSGYLLPICEAVPWIHVRLTLTKMVWECFYSSSWSVLLSLLKIQHSPGMLVIFFTSWSCAMEAFLAYANVSSGGDDYLATLGFYSKVTSSNDRKGIRAPIWNITYYLYELLYTSSSISSFNMRPVVPEHHGLGLIADLVRKNSSYVTRVKKSESRTRYIFKTLQEKWPPENVPRDSFSLVSCPDIALQLSKRRWFWYVWVLFITGNKV